MSRIVRVPLERLRAGERALDRKTSHYLERVLRLRSGDHFLAFDPVARDEADAEIVSAAPELVCRLSEPRAAPPGQRGPTLIQALGKGDKIAEVLRAATALGASRILVVQTERTVARGEPHTEPPARWQALCVDAARQSGRSDLPVLEGPLELAEALERVQAEPGPKWCFDPAAADSFQPAAAAWSRASPPVLLIGPEGGLSESEVGQARAKGFVALRFGSLVLRTEIAGTAILGALVGLG